MRAGASSWSTWSRRRATGEARLEVMRPMVRSGTGPKTDGGAPMRLWGGRFQSATDPLVADFTRSVDMDRRAGGGRPRRLDRPRRRPAAGRPADTRPRRPRWSGAWTACARRSPPARSPGIRRSRTSTSTSRRPSRRGSGRWPASSTPGRSRNDQVATDLRLWLRRTCAALDVRLADLERALVGLAAAEATAVLPGTTHLQPAQPVLLAHHLLAYVEMLERDRGRLADARPPRERLAARLRRPGRRGLPAGPRGHGPRPGVRAA